MTVFREFRPQVNLGLKSNAGRAVQLTQLTQRRQTRTLDEGRVPENRGVCCEHQGPAEDAVTMSLVAFGQEREPKPCQTSNHKSVDDLLWDDGVPAD